MKNEKLEIIESNEFQNLFDKSKKLIDSARSNMGQMANAITVLTSFLLGRYIIEQEQQGSERAKYGAKVLEFFVIIFDRRIWQRFFKKQCCRNAAILHGLQR